MVRCLRFFFFFLPPPPRTLLHSPLFSSSPAMMMIMMMMMMMIMMLRRRGKRMRITKFMMPLAQKHHFNNSKTLGTQSMLLFLVNLIQPPPGLLQQSEPPFQSNYPSMGRIGPRGECWGRWRVGTLSPIDYPPHHTNPAQTQLDVLFLYLLRAVSQTVKKHFASELFNYIPNVFGSHRCTCK